MDVIIDEGGWLENALKTLQGIDILLNSTGLFSHILLNSTGLFSHAGVKGNRGVNQHMLN